MGTYALSEVHMTMNHQGAGDRLNITLDLGTLRNHGTLSHEKLRTIVLHNVRPSLLFQLIQWTSESSGDCEITL